MGIQWISDDERWQGGLVSSLFSSVIHDGTAHNSNIVIVATSHNLWDL